MRHITEYHRPKQIEEALTLLARPNVLTVPIGGGSELVAEDRRDVEAVVDLRDLGLTYIRHEGDALRIGATTTLQILIDSPESAHAWDGELARVVALTAARNLREAGTIAGTLVSAEHDNPLAALLLALNASVTILNRRLSLPLRYRDLRETPPTNNQTVSLDEFLPQRETLLRGALITEVTIPLPRSGEAIAFEKVSRTPADLPIVCAAVRARIDGGVAREVRIGLGGVGSLPARAPRIEQALEGRSLDQQSIEKVSEASEDIDPPSDFLGSRAYRREMVAVLVRRAIRRLCSTT